MPVRKLRRRGAGRARVPFTLLLPNLVTILGLCFGLTSIRFAFDDRFDLAAGLLILAALVDGMDGLLARRLDAASPFGAELDSLSDFVCFGVAPALLVYHFALGGLAGLGWIAALFLAICCCLRLARFNVMRDDPDPAFKSGFMGVPAPAGAMLAILPVHLYLADLADPRAATPLVAAWVVAVGLLMVARFRTLSIKAMRVSRDNAIWVLLAAAVVVGLMLTRLWLFAVGASAFYLAILAWGAISHRKRAGPPASPED
jgi:CDP-diacylglycerol--serine O-phosphatidyltransferase